ncbi:MAG TPA: hypothetical protein DCM45_03510 [Clostridiales bacterium]|nr:hypothetical protein [Clostridiales bacterium]
MEQQFPRTTVGGISVSRMIMGSNWLLGWSHTSQAADKLICDRYNESQKFHPMLEAWLRHGVDTIMAPFNFAPKLVQAVHEVEDKTGKQIIMVDTPIFNVDDCAAARQEAEKAIQQCAANGSKICLIHHGCCEELVNKNKRTIERFDDYTKMIRDAGMIPGTSGHMPEVVLFCDQNGYDVETYIQIYNPMGFMMQIEIETVATIINNAKKPVMTIKPMAAGRCTPFVGLTFAWNTIRACDMVTVGAHTPEEVEEDIAISLAAIEHRMPKLGQRGSPAENQAVLNK